MRTRVRVALWAVGIAGCAVLVVAVLAGAIILRNIQRSDSSELDAAVEFDRVRARFPARPALVELVDPREGVLRINRPPESAPRLHVESIFILGWTPADRKLVRTSAPVWLMHLSLQNMASRFGLGRAPWSLTVADVERYGPGVVLDFRDPRGTRVLIWVE